MKVILDTNFILTCIKDRIDFLSQLEEQGFEILVPHEVLEEMKDIRKKVSRDTRIVIDVAFQLFDKENVKKVKLGRRSVDLGLIKKGREGYYIATLDAEIKGKVPKRVVIFSGKKEVGVEKG
ncbi:hypothetical protein COU62_02965 [Candidatus Pacearchaeota archaeon CG10_big_fil_rev_8_21_14_0_10_35_219]|nr:hypothetical protein [Candidatus Pacearchaeota archaeon]OIO42620.1 MAG: hypothetical protein AUJ63_02420 [Candidatus Pacearchaeota archaeon CG1_02_35_32]PIO07590.1 MAG: hypothetical protein COU62_02965 [Candidatus Pacearchaeota archaeon CG10_big_fil_rev_8_21_14_0_10_35_219]PIY81926.1 MAG: hypothetical protein COY79_00125 [Candidatus Pacearchaeota archaeon CG_4_10_14_0_8_um_filter_35_169]PIZ80579.1 MAG: hypothetical protein COY00_00940 [Candidatus Pacearchaeota archaeon CG_4_10_14_0_2_um_filt